MNYLIEAGGYLGIGIGTLLLAAAFFLVLMSRKKKGQNPSSFLGLPKKSLPQEDEKDAKSDYEAQELEQLLRSQTRNGDKVLTELTIPNADKTEAVSFTHLFISKRGIFAFALVRAEGILGGNASDEEWVEKKADGSVELIGNPRLELQKKLADLQALLGNELPLFAWVIVSGARELKFADESIVLEKDLVSRLVLLHYVVSEEQRDAAFEKLAFYKLHPYSQDGQ
jgi:hypothetical protein